MEVQSVHLPSSDACSPGLAETEYLDSHCENLKAWRRCTYYGTTFLLALEELNIFIVYGKYYSPTCA
ncbi:DEHA2F15004p [Debaryomyces hansenii CBS767]|uniref:DEHA2F15004p n=1 Tax=Debaryomyces hansenii (strain ATCC 36239 / CBS 767 / BCRC 21394 / JCM 1990 / NBRC 0083 / IGC 2968) TaxID=284592 RepID=Q6BLA9_DEBHA|nr:DEHA2F15004p [Debaryomyces hansenii CBS767]CAG89382.2 DEHA2F15004p [Debaryomyces hansenii CBS767]|eukprot:XP_461012.2 DEHA2F15004p [Debaryomyces hansenii CBS767]